MGPTVLILQPSALMNQQGIISHIVAAQNLSSTDILLENHASTPSHPSQTGSISIKVGILLHFR